MTIAEWMKRAIDALRSTNCPDPEIDARWIAEDVLGMSASELRFAAQNTPDAKQQATLDDALRRRCAGEPVQYILRRADFMGLKLYVDERALIPRQDTESLVEAAIVALHGKPGTTVLDLCAGSGAIGLSVATLVPGAKVTLTDLSADALEVAWKNAKLLNVDAEFRLGDLFQAVEWDQYDLIVSNPPYIPSGELRELQREVQFEPALALDGGADGLDFYRRIAQEAGKHLNPGGSVYLEVGAGEAEAVLELLRTHLDAAASGIQKDLNGIERIVWLRSV